MAKKKLSKASRGASQKLMGEQTAKGKGLNEESLLTSNDSDRSTHFLNQPVRKGMRLTWKAVLMFLLTCFILDMGLYFLFNLGLDSCYAVLCLFEGGKI